MRALVLALLTVILAAAPLSAQEVSYRVYHAVQIHRTDLHTTVYRMMEECTGKDGDPEGVEWYAAKAILRLPDGTLMKGMWVPKTDPTRIYLDGSYVWSGSTISHEVLHDLYQGQPDMDTAERCKLDAWAFHEPPGK